MKCDKHGIEMKWRGSLMKGGMYCVCCDAGAPAVEKGTAIHEAFADAIATGTGVLGIDPGQLQGSFNSPPPAPRAPAPVPGLKAVITPPAAKSVDEALHRIKEADYMNQILFNGAIFAHCPYCLGTVGKVHTSMNDRQGAECYRAYNRDHDVVSRGFP